MKRIFFSGLKGGLGTTSVIANLATLLAQSERAVVCIDLDNKNELALHLGHPWQDLSGWSNCISQDNDEWLNNFFENEDGVCYLPFGNNIDAPVQKLVNTTKNLDLTPSTWLLIDCPSGTQYKDLSLQQDDLFLQLIQCDAACYSLLSRQAGHQLNHFYLINNFNAQSALETDIYQLWRANLKGLAPFFIHTDEAVKEALAYKNVLINSAPYSVVKEDYQALASWLTIKLKD